MSHFLPFYFSTCCLVFIIFVNYGEKFNIEERRGEGGGASLGFFVPVRANSFVQDREP